MMKQLLIVSPHFPPTDKVDMHRVRMNVGHYREHGWEPSVLCVEPACAEAAIDPKLMTTVPDDLDVCRTGAAPLALSRLVGVTDISLRARSHLRAEGAKMIARKRPDLVFISTTQFQAMPLGAYWRRLFGVPFVLDLQDPWHTAPASTAAFRRRGLKHSIMRRLHGVMEAQTVPMASGLISVSSAYIDALRARYAAARQIPAATIPFGHSDADFEAAVQHGRAWRPFETTQAGPQSGLTCVYAGRIGADSAASLETFFWLLSTAIQRRIAPLDAVRAAFLGAGYKRSGNRPAAAGAAAEFSLSHRIAERADRLPLLDALKTMQSADLLLILGSDDLAYQPSKLFQCLALDKPVICVAPSESRLAHFVEKLSSVVFVPAESRDVAAVENAATGLHRLMKDSDGAASRERRSLAAQYSARSLAARECELFESALAYSRTRLC